MRNLFLIYILFFSFFATLNAQDKKIDSLLSQIKSSEGQSKVKSLLELTNYYHKQNEEQSLKYAKEALKESQRIKYTYGEIDALSNMALSNIYLTEYENALNYSLEALKKAEAEKNESQCAECYSLLGHAYLNMSNFTLADQNFNKALQLYIKLDDKLNIATMYNNIAVSFDNRNILDSALKYYQIAFPIYETLEKNNDLYKGLWYTNVGDLYRKQGKNREALEMQLKAEPLLINANDQHTLLVLYSGMPYTFIEGKQYDKALYYALKAVELGKKLNVKRELAYAHLAVADVYGEKNDFKNQVIYLQRYIELSDSLFLDETSRSITEMQSKYESEKKEKAIELLNKNKALQEAEIEKHKSKQIFYIGVVIFVLALSITLAVGIKNKNQANKILSQQKIEIQNQKHLVDEKQKKLSILLITRNDYKLQF
ncbi:MAG: tetratricopeptide repeat protein [Bacteroidetes bacterium]|nr:tetratricopeptide repeat protein [Bacteroidota bacterium]